MAEIISSVTPWSDISMKSYQWLDECLQKQPSTEKEFQSAWQAYKYLICGKMYAYIGIDDRNISVLYFQIQPYTGGQANLRNGIRFIPLGISPEDIQRGRISHDSKRC